MSIYFIPNADRGLSNYAGRNVRFGFPLPARERRMQSLLGKTNLMPPLQNRS